MTNHADASHVTGRPKQVLLTCMDPRIAVDAVLERLSASFEGWLASEPTYVIRNAGAVATDDAVRSLIVVQRLAAAPAVADLVIAVVGHDATAGPPCAMTTRTDDALTAELVQDPSIKRTPPFAFEFFEGGADGGARRSVAYLRATPFIREGTTRIRGFVYTTDAKVLRAVT
jgi:carbonic anhydrase